MRFILGIRKGENERKSIIIILGEEEEEKESKGGAKEEEAINEGLDQLKGRGTSWQLKGTHPKTRPTHYRAVARGRNVRKFHTGWRAQIPRKDAVYLTGRDFLDSGQLGAFIAGSWAQISRQNFVQQGRTVRVGRIGRTAVPAELCVHL